MVNRTIPFRPKLEGVFRKRFYDIAAEMTANNSNVLISSELDWVENKCTFNFQQRRKFRAVLLLLRDLLNASWDVNFRAGVLELSMPTLENEELHGDAAIAAKKDKLRSWLSESRLERLATFKKFVEYMEDEKSTVRRPISVLIADGAELSQRLQNATDIAQAVCPVLQLVVENDRDEITGHKISDIWRYMRLTWATPSENTPGRTMQYLIRDHAHPNHPVMGIISLENCAVQITDRDAFIGWNAGEFIADLKKRDVQEAMKTIGYLLERLKEGIVGIDTSGVSISPEKVNAPDENAIAMLMQEATFAEEIRQSEMRQSFLRQAIDEDGEEYEKSELGSISKPAEDALYKRKRAEQLARLLYSKMELTALLANPNFEKCWQEYLNTEKGYSAVRNALVAQKSKHIGSSMLELNVCGAIPPYNEILGGKLAALLALSPQIISDYRNRYGHRKSEIASRLKNEDVVRPAELVYVGTTSLYYVGSSQYNRLKLPSGILSNEKDIRWNKLGKTVGFGTLHISKATTSALVEAAEHIGFTRINHVFGEGASPKLRLLNLSIRELLETGADDANNLAKHTMSRIVYGACLAKNAQDYLLGRADVPEYYYEGTGDGVRRGTEAIVRYWQERWLASRIKYEPIYTRLQSFNAHNIIVGNQIDSDWSYKPLEIQKEEANMDAERTENRLGVDFIRSLYRGSSAYADNLPTDYLERIHIATKLDDAVFQAVFEGKDVVLTGSPGDGKTHIIRVIKPKLDELHTPPIIELDASCLSNEQLYQKWSDAKASGKPFILAVNAAVLFSLATNYPTFQPLHEAWEQMKGAVVYDQGTLPASQVVVFDLSRRQVLEKEIVSKAIERICDEEFYAECRTCPNRDNCPVHPYREVIKQPIFQERLDELFSRIALKGEHISLRELLSFFSYILFGGRSCSQLNATVGNDEYSLLTLIYGKGHGQSFEYIRHSFDPAEITHPVWDEKLLSAQVKENWETDYFNTTEAIDSNNTSQFELRKRQFFFFNRDGQALIDICDDEISLFKRFMEENDDKKIIKELIAKLNAFFGVKRTRAELDVWNGHRFNNSPRSMLVSTDKLKVSKFDIGRPTLRPSMQSGIDTRYNYILLRRSDNHDVFLRIDLEMFCLFAEAERGVPMLFIENPAAKRVWRFIEQLQGASGNLDDELTITLLDVEDKKELCVTIDMEDKRYTSIAQYKIQM
jgi:hypothetical protein